MTNYDLLRQCLDSMAHPERSGSMEPGIVLISAKRGGLFPKGGGPKAKILGSDSRGYFLWYDAKDVLAALVARGVVKCTEAEGGMKFEVIDQKKSPSTHSG